MTDLFEVYQPQVKMNCRKNKYNNENKDSHMSLISSFIEKTIFIIRSVIKDDECILPIF